MLTFRNRCAPAVAEISSEFFSALSRNFLGVSLAIAVWALTSPVMAITFTTLDDPLAVGPNSMTPTGVSGQNVVGSYRDATGTSHGFLYNGSTFSTIDAPSGALATYPLAIDGDNIVGWYLDSSRNAHGFLVNGGTFTTIDDPLAPTSSQGTHLTGISGNNIVGFEVISFDPFVVHSFIYNGSTFATYTVPGTFTAGLFGIDGNTLVGSYSLSDSTTTGHGFVDRGSVITSIDDPLATPLSGTFVNGVSANNVVGYFTDVNGQNHGFVFNGATYIAIDDPNAGAKQFGTIAYAISGNTVVGSYWDANNVEHGFIATNVPEPSTLILSALGALTFLTMRWRK